MACRVGICDDMAEYRSLLSAVLAADPRFEVVGEAGDGIEAVELVRERAPDVLLLDVSMPRMSGLEALPLVRAADADVAVIILTGLTNPELREVTAGHEHVRWLEKGSTPEQITEAVTEMCPRGEAR